MHDDRDLGRARKLLDLCDQLAPLRIREHQIDDLTIETLTADRFHGLSAGPDTGDRNVLSTQKLFHASAKPFVVLNNKKLLDRTLGKALEPTQALDQLIAIGRLCL